MRLSEEIIKQAILHPQLEIRQRAVRYFSNCHSEDESIVPLVIQAEKALVASVRSQDGNTRTIWVSSVR